MSINLCMAVINANDVSIFSIEVANGKKVTCLKSDKVGNILVPVNNLVSQAFPDHPS